MIRGVDRLPHESWHNNSGYLNGYEKIKSPAFTCIVWEKAGSFRLLALAEAEAGTPVERHACLRTGHHHLGWHGGCLPDPSHVVYSSLDLGERGVYSSHASLLGAAWPRGAEDGL